MACHQQAESCELCEAVCPPVQGILIEASPGQSHTMRIMRPAAVCVNAGVCSAHTSVHYAEGGEDNDTEGLHF